MDLSALPDPVRARYDALLAVAGSTVVGLDFDGTLSPIVPDPAVERRVDALWSALAQPPASSAGSANSGSSNRRG